MKRFRFVVIGFFFAAGLLFSSCAQPEQAEKPLNATDKPVVFTLDPTAKPEQTAQNAPAEPKPIPTVSPTETTTSQPDGKGIVQFTIVLHLEGWADGENEKSFTRHAAQLRDYADLFEQYHATMTLESKEIIDGCIRWGDNVLLEMQNRGHAVSIHADAGGNKNATIKSMVQTLDEMQENLLTLGIQTSAASGVASKANWVEACEKAGIDTVSCMVEYGLWSLDPEIRPSAFQPYDNPAEGHGPYPFELEDRVHPWIAGDGSDWIMNDPNGSVVIMPTGLSLNGASGELNGTNEFQSEFTQEDIDAWREALPRVIAASDSASVNTFYAVWSFGQAVDMDLLEEWLALIDEYVQAGSIRWSTIPQMAQLYCDSLG